RTSLKTRRLRTKRTRRRGTSASCPGSPTSSCAVRASSSKTRANWPTRRTCSAGTVSEANGSAADTGPGESGPDVRAEDADPLRRALELCVYAPLGLALTAVEDLPAVAAKGRDRVELELSNARVVGRFMVARARRELTGRLGVGRKGEEGA